MRSDDRNCLEAVQFGRLNIHKAEVEAARLEPLEGITAIGGDDTFMADSLQYADGNRLVRGTTYGQQDAQSSRQLLDLEPAPAIRKMYGGEQSCMG